MARHKTLLAIVAIALAVGAPLLMAAKAYKEQRGYPVIKVEIEPYDPRDLLYGHYMMFAMKWNWADKKPDPVVCQTGNCCLCLGPEVENPSASLVACDPVKSPEKPPQCTHILQGQFYGDDIFNIGIDRYFVDETIALPLENLFRNKKEKFHVGLSISPQGKAILERLYVAGKPVNQYVDEQGGSISLPGEQSTPATP